MEYPFWDLPFGYGILIAGVASFMSSSLTSRSAAGCSWS